MNLLLPLLLVGYPFGLFGTGPASSSDAGMMLAKGVFAAEYNPAGLAWVDSLEAGVAAQGLFRYNLLGAAYRYQDYPLAITVSHRAESYGLALAGGYLMRPLALGAGFGVNLDTLARSQTFFLRAGLQWRDYVGVALGPKLATSGEGAHLSVLGQVGAAIPIPVQGIEGLDVLLGGLAELVPPRFRIGGGLAFEPVKGIKAQSVVSIEDWGIGVLLGNQKDRGGIWIHKKFTPDDPWEFGFSYVRNVRSQEAREVVIYRNLPGRVDTVYLTAEEPEDTTTYVTSPRVRRKQEELMGRANTYYSEERYEDAIRVWREVVSLDPQSDLARRAREDIEEVTTLLETLERIRSGCLEDRPH